MPSCGHFSVGSMVVVPWTRGGSAVSAEPEDVARPVRSSFDDVYAAESRAIVGLAALLVGSQDVAEELAQDAFLRLFEHFDEVTSPAGFLRTVVVRLCLTWHKRRTTEQRLVRQVGVDRPSSIPEVDETWAALAARSGPAGRAGAALLRATSAPRDRRAAGLPGGDGAQPHPPGPQGPPKGARPMITSRRLTAVLTRTLEVKAEQAMTVEASPSDRSDEVRDASEPPPLRVMPRRAPAERRRLLPAAAALAVLALVAAGAGALRRDAAEDRVSVAAMGDPPDGWLAPAWMPDGMELWGLDFSSSSGEARLSERTSRSLSCSGTPTGAGPSTSRRTGTRSWPTRPSRSRCGDRPAGRGPAGTSRRTTSARRSPGTSGVRPSPPCTRGRPGTRR